MQEKIKQTQTANKNKEIVVLEDGTPIKIKYYNQYLSLSQIGKGAFGKVRLCKDVEGNCYRAMKVLNRALLKRLAKQKGPRFVKDPMMDVKREIEIMEILDHRNIVKLYEIIDDPSSNSVYLVYEYAAGGVLFQMKSTDDDDDDDENNDDLDNNNNNNFLHVMHEDTARHYFRELLHGLSYLHSQNVVHRDIKPENLLIQYDAEYLENINNNNCDVGDNGYDALQEVLRFRYPHLYPQLQEQQRLQRERQKHSLGVLKIADFGEASLLEGEKTLIKTQGTPAYYAPEVCLGGTYKGPPVDIWAAGITLFNILTGKAPIIDNNIMELMRKIQEDDVVIPKEFSPELKDILTKILTKDPDLRPTADELLQHPWLQLSSIPSNSQNHHHLADINLKEQTEEVEVEQEKEKEREQERVENNVDDEIKQAPWSHESMSPSISTIFTVIPTKEQNGLSLHREDSLIYSQEKIRQQQSNNNHNNNHNNIIINNGSPSSPQQPQESKSERTTALATISTPTTRKTTTTTTSAIISTLSPRIVYSHQNFQSHIASNHYNNRPIINNFGPIQSTVDIAPFSSSSSSSPLHASKSTISRQLLLLPPQQLSAIPPSSSPWSRHLLFPNNNYNFNIQPIISPDWQPSPSPRIQPQQRSQQYYNYINSSNSSNNGVINNNGNYRY